ncbi:hypothetical protein [Phormidium sp. CCY1219]|nr:hypothetical protein [Phormidium sp. CCY1219]
MADAQKGKKSKRKLPILAILQKSRQKPGISPLVGKRGKMKWQNG